MTKPTNIDGKPKRRGPLLSPKQASEVLGIPTGTLADWRSQRRGPPFYKIEGHLIRYSQAELDAWVAGQRVELPQETRNQAG
jgi:excisionase family DNA binding protein